MREILYFSVFFCIVSLVGAIALNSKQEARCEPRVAQGSSDEITGREALNFISKFLN